MVKFLTAEEAVAQINDNDTLATSGFVSNGFAEVLAQALEKRFLETGKPSNLTLVYSAGQVGVNHFAHEGMLKRVIGGHWNLSPDLGKLATEEKIEAYNLPQGTICHMFRDIAAGKLGTLTHVGLKTFVDPDIDGGAINNTAKAQKNAVEKLVINGKEQLLYKAFPINVCLLRGTTADEKGNISLEKEGVTLDTGSIAQATKCSGGKVIVQVERVVKAGTLDPRLVKIPGVYVDTVVVVPPAENMPEADASMSPACNGDIRIPTDAIPALPMSERKIIARRAAMELQPDAIVNLGIGMPEAVAVVANEEGIGDYMTLTVEAGPVGGVPAGGGLFGLSINPDTILDEPYQFDFYDGGGLDLAFLGLAECDEKGNINVSKMGPRITGCGGFINITQNAKRLFFCGTFTTKGLKVGVEDGKLKIIQEGAKDKFLNMVVHVTFSGDFANSVGQPVMYITERAVFELRKDGLYLTEVAPGIDIEKDIFAHMAFKPKMDGEPKLMDARIFREEPMGLGK